MSRTAESQHRRPRRRRNQRARNTTEPSRIEIHAAVPDGSRRAHNQPEALRAFETRIALEADLGRLRSDAERNALNIARAVVFSAHWGTLVTRPGWDTLIDRCGRSRSTIAKYLALFNEWGLLGRVRPGSTRRTRGNRNDDENGNLAGEYILCVPVIEEQQATEPVEETRTPSLLRKEERSTACESSTRTRARARETRPWPIHATPETTGEQRQAADRLRQQIPVLARISRKHLATILKPWFELGWNPAQIRYALDHTPDGAARWHTNDIRHIAGWVRYRLGQWNGHTPPRQLGTGQSTDLTAADVAALPRPAEPVADTATHASRARQLLAATLKRRSDKKPARGLGVLLPDRDGETTGPIVEQQAEAEPADSADWLLRNAAKRAEPTSAFGGLDLGAIA